MEIFTNFDNIIERLNKNETVLFIWNDDTIKPSLIIKDKELQPDGSTLYFSYNIETNEKEPVLYEKNDKIGLLGTIEDSFLTKGMMHTVRPRINITINTNNFVPKSWEGSIKLMKTYTHEKSDGTYITETEIKGIITFKASCNFYKDGLSELYNSAEDVFNAIYNSDFMKAHPRIRAWFYMVFFMRKNSSAIFDKNSKIEFETAINNKNLNTSYFMMSH